MISALNNISNTAPHHNHNAPRVNKQDTLSIMTCSSPACLLDTICNKTCGAVCPDATYPHLCLQRCSLPRAVKTKHAEGLVHGLPYTLKERHACWRVYYGIGDAHVRHRLRHEPHHLGTGIQRAAAVGRLLAFLNQRMKLC